MRTRRRFLKTMTGAAALLWLRERAHAENDLQPLMAKIAGGQAVRQGRVHLDIPPLADNGHSVPLAIRIDSPMTATDHVRTITLLSERNPRPLIATYRLGPRSGKAVVATRVRLNGTQRLVALAELSDGSVWSGSAEVVVTESACLDAS
jgi:sulfur-oxidizing protein SoxY